jgi:hypothetical protein
MRTEPYDDGIRIIMNDENDVKVLDDLMVGTDNAELFRFLESTLEGNEVSEILYPSDENNHPDMVSKYMNWFVLRPFTPILRPYGRSISILYLVASPSLRRRLDTMLQPPHRAAHKAYVEEFVRPSQSVVNTNPAVAASRKKSRKVKRKRRTTFRRKY